MEKNTAVRINEAGHIFVDDYELAGEQLYNALMKYPHGTKSKTLAKLLGWSGQTIGRLFITLQKQGRVMKSDRQPHVYVVAPPRTAASNNQVPEPEQLTTEKHIPNTRIQLYCIFEDVTDPAVPGRVDVCDSLEDAKERAAIWVKEDDSITIMYAEILGQVRTKPAEIEFVEFS